MFTQLAGAANSSVILHVPHASTTIPASARSDILLTEAELARELQLVTDVATDTIAVAVAGQAITTPTVFTNQLSRLVVDPERFVDDREPMAAQGLGAVYRRTQYGAPLRDDGYNPEPLLTHYYHPYHAALTAVVNDHLARHHRVTIIDVHSYPLERFPSEQAPPQAARPDICLGTDPFHTPPTLLTAAKEVFTRYGFTWAVNSPYDGTFVPLQHYQRTAAVNSVMVEIRRDVYEKWHGPEFVIGNRFHTLVNAITDLVNVS